MTNYKMLIFPLHPVERRSYSHTCIQHKVNLKKKKRKENIISKPLAILEFWQQNIQKLDIFSSVGMSVPIVAEGTNI